MKQRIEASLSVYLLIMASVILASLVAIYFIITANLDGIRRTYISNEGFGRTAEIVETARKNFTLADRKDLLQGLLKSRLEELDAQMKVIDLSGKILYDSEDRSDRFVNILQTEAWVGAGTSFRKSDPGYMFLSYPVLLEGVQTGNVLLKLPEKEIYDIDLFKIAISVLLPFAICIFLIIILISLIVRSIRRDVLRPLEMLSGFAKNISKGKLDEEVPYRKDNEVGAFCSAFDLMRTELKNSLVKQAEHEKAHKELIASVSHDLRTPLSSIKAYVEGLQDGIARDADAYRRYLAVIKKKTDSLVILVNELMQYSLEELEQFRINPKELYSKELLEDIIILIRVQFEKGSVEFIAEGEIPNVLLKVDSVRIEQVILNLVQNAKKYTPPGGKIYFSSAAEGNFLKVSVKDTGCGIAEEDKAYIFDKFYRGEKSKTSVIEGSGLGLSICKNIVEKHGGRISAESSLNKGSTFTFTLPKV
jgi:signal transduction histidine kinase